MARMKKKKESKKFSFRKLVKSGKVRAAALITTLGLAGAGGIYGYDKLTDITDKGIEYDTDDLDKDKLVIEPPIEEKELEPTIKDEIKNSKDKDKNFDDEQVKIDQEAIEEALKQIVEIGEEYLEECKKESLEVSKDKETTITSYSLDDLVIPIIKNFETVSIVDALNEVGYDSSEASRARLAVYFKIVNSEKEYDKSSEQNTLLLEALREYARNLQATVYNDYAPVIDNKTIENSVPDNGNSDNISNTDNGQSDNDNNKDDKDNKDDKKDKDKKHKWGKWLPLDDEYEHRFRDDGKEEKQKHPSYGEYSDNGDDTKSRTCDNCGHTMTKDYVWGPWTAIDDEYEHCFREDGEEKIQKHPYGDWIDNGNNTESNTCPNCNHIVTRDKKPEHIHHPEAQKPVSLEKTDEEHCMVIKYVCPEDDYEDESLREYIDHSFSKDPILVDGDQGLFECDRCGLQITKTLEPDVPEEHIHHPEAQKPVSLEKTDEEHCMVIKYVCPEDDYEDESLREYIDHSFSKDPILVDGDQGLFECDRCGLQITKTITNTDEESIDKDVKQDEISLEETTGEQEEGIVFNFDFDIPFDEYEFMETEEEPDVDFQPPAVRESTELIVTEVEEELEEVEIKQIEQKEILQIEDKSISLQNENKDNTENIIASFDKELYKELFKGKVALEQSLATLKGIEREEKLQLLNDINTIRKSMVQDLANALVQEELNKVEKGQSQGLIFKM